MKELRHFFTFQNGPHAHARIDFSDSKDDSVRTKVTVEMEVAVNSGNEWDNFVEDVRKLLRYAPKESGEGK